MISQNHTRTWSYKRSVRYITCGYIIINSICTKLKYLCELDTGSADIIPTAETKLDSSFPISSSEFMVFTKLLEWI